MLMFTKGQVAASAYYGWRCTSTKKERGKVEVPTKEQLKMLTKGHAEMLTRDLVT